MRPSQVGAVAVALALAAAVDVVRFAVDSLRRFEAVGLHPLPALVAVCGVRHLAAHHELVAAGTGEVAVKHPFLLSMWNSLDLILTAVALRPGVIWANSVVPDSICVMRLLPWAFPADELPDLLSTSRHGCWLDLESCRMDTEGFQSVTD